MFDLVRKDLIIGAIFLPVIALFITFITYTALWAMMDDFGGIILGLFTLIVLILCVASSFLFIGIDNANKADMIYASLPIKKLTIVAARYFSSIMMVIVSIAFVESAILAARTFSGGFDPDFNLLCDWRWITGMLSMMVLIICYYLPFVFIFGAGKGAMAAFIIQITLTVAVPVFKFIVKALAGIIAFDLEYFARIFRALLHWLSSLHNLQSCLMLAAFVVSIVMISCTLSVLFYKRMDY